LIDPGSCATCPATLRPLIACGLGSGFRTRGRGGGAGPCRHRRVRGVTTAASGPGYTARR
jgi:hypothetical protein